MTRTNDKEEELQATFNGLIEQYKLNTVINPKNGLFKEPVALDVEHDESGNFVGCGMYQSINHTCYYYSDVLLLRAVDFSVLSLICHNGRSDFDVLRSWGIDVKDNQLVWDTELISHILDSSRHGYGLKTLASSDLGISYPSYDDIVGRRTLKQVKERRTLDKWPVSIVSAYNAMDCFSTYKLYESQVSMLRSGRETAETQKYFEQIERPIAFILNRMENRGICVDLQYLETLKRDLETEKLPIENEIKNDLGNINLNSSKQLLGGLNAKDIYPTFKGKASTDKRALENHKNHRIVQLLFKYSELDTLLSTFVKPYLERNESIIRPWFNQCGTRTGRLSCSKPNLLQIPKRTQNGKRVRRMFIPRPGMLFGDCDFGQIEPRVLAHLSKDEILCKMFNDGVDFHAFTSERLGITRERAKVLNLSVGYRATKYSVQRQLGGTLDEAQEQIDKWWNLFPNLRRWQETIIYESRRSGFCTTLLGRRIKVDALTEGNPWKREAAERQLINNITQGSAAEIMKLAMLKIHKCAPSLGLLVQVYDELLFESPRIIEDLEIVKKSMECAIKLDVPLTIDCKQGNNWGDCTSQEKEK
jgi:DNA polymerase-1